MEPITQDKRVSQGHNGDLYFSNVMLQDMQTDYSCNARFHFTHTIQQKNPFTLKVLTSKCRPCLGLGSQEAIPKSTHTGAGSLCLSHCHCLMRRLSMQKPVSSLVLCSAGACTLIPRSSPLLPQQPWTLSVPFTLTQKFLAFD